MSKKTAVKEEPEVPEVVEEPFDGMPLTDLDAAIETNKTGSKWGLILDKHGLTGKYMRYKGTRYFKAYDYLYKEEPPTKCEMANYMLRCLKDGGFCSIDLDLWGTQHVDINNYLNPKWFGDNCWKPKEFLVKENLQKVVRMLTCLSDEEIEDILNEEIPPELETEEEIEAH